MNVPQADDVEKILDLPLAVGDGENTKEEITKRYTVDPRQIDCYLEAGEILGLVHRDLGSYSLTEDGKRYRRMDPSQQKRMLIRKMITLPIVTMVVAELIASETSSISRYEVEELIKLHSGIHGATAQRRTQTLITWFRWMGDQTGVFVVDEDTIRLKPSINRPISQ